MNSFVVLVQLGFSEQLEDAAEKAKISTQFIWAAARSFIA